MKITIELDEEIKDAIQLHLEKEISVHDYIKAALRFFRDLRRKEEQGFSIGYGDKNRFATYNHEVSPTNYLDNPE